MNKINKTLLIAAFAILLSVVFLLNPVSNVFETYESRSLDLRFLIRGPLPKTDSPVIICLVDDNAAMKHGFRSPTPRTMLAEVISNLKEKGARGIGVDIILDMATIEEQDKALEETLDRSGKRVVLINRPPAAAGYKNSSRDSEVFGPVLQRFRQHAETGYSEIVVGSGEIARWIGLLPVRNQPSFVEQLYENYTGTSLEEIAQLSEIADSNRVLLDFPGSPSRFFSSNPYFSVFSVEELLNLPEAFIKDKIILIGSGMEDLGDVFLTPFSTSSNGYLTAFGVELHAIALDMLFQERFLRTSSTLTDFLLFLFLFLVAGILFIRLRTRYAVAVLAGVVVLWAGISVIAFSAWGLIIPLFLPILGLLFLFLVTEIVKNFWTQRQSRFLQKTFKRYLSPDLVDMLVNQQKQPDMGGEDKLITILFSDLQGFTGLSERLSPHDLVDLLNDYLAEMTATVFQQLGTLDKYQGDAIMAIYGAPLELENHAVQACHTAVRMQQKMVQLNRNLEARGLPLLKVRIGVNTGEAVVGNIGSEERMDYTAVGDAVNLASRLEGVNKFFGTDIIISEDTCHHVADLFETRELGKIVVKGKTNPVRIYELIGLKKAGETLETERKSIYESALHAFYRSDFDKAETLFRKALKTYEDSPSRYMLNQVSYYRLSPPSDQWEGEVVLLQK